MQNSRPSFGRLSVLTGCVVASFAAACACGNEELLGSHRDTPNTGSAAGTPTGGAAVDMEPKSGVIPVPGAGGAPTSSESGGGGIRSGESGITTDGGVPPRISDAGNDAGAVCFSGRLTNEATLTPGLLFVIDRSASMGCQMPGGTSSYFDALRTGLAAAAQMVRVPLDVGVEFFGGGTAQCNVAGYVESVPVGSFPGNAAAIDQAFGTPSTASGAPLFPALESAIARALDRRASPNGAPAIVLVVGAEATTCGSLEQIGAAVAAAAAKDVEIFVVAVPTPASACDLSSVPTDTSSLDAIATAAELPPIVVPHSRTIALSGNDLSAEFANSLSTILGRRAQNLGCRYELPPMPEGFLDRTVSVVYTDASSGTVSIPEGPKEFCPGFYYDDPSAPTAVGLCPTRCQAVQRQDTQLRIEVSCAKAAGGSGGSAGVADASTGGEAGEGGALSRICPMTPSFPAGDYYTDSIEAYRQDDIAAQLTRLHLLESNGNLTIRREASGAFDVVFGAHEFDRVMTQNLSDGLHIDASCSLGRMCPGSENDGLDLIIDAQTGLVHFDYFEYRDTMNYTARTAGIAWPECETTSASRPPGIAAPAADGASVVPPDFPLGCSEEFSFTGSGATCPASVPTGCTCRIDEGGNMDEMCCGSVQPR